MMTGGQMNGVAAEKLGAGGRDGGREDGRGEEGGW